MKLDHSCKHARADHIFIILGLLPLVKLHIKLFTDKPETDKTACLLPVEDCYLKRQLTADGVCKLSKMIRV